ncbi:MAG: sigma-54 dependent transcriptional regulator [Pseudomonadota bacterium]
MPNHILIADDNADVIAAFSYLLETEGYVVSAAATPAAVLNEIRKTAFNLLLMDLNYSRDTTSGSEGLELLHQVLQLDEQLPVVVITAWGSIETAVEAMKKGARDFLLKPWNNEHVLSVVNNQILRQQAENRNRKLAEEVHLLKDAADADGALVSKAPAMQRLLDQLQSAAATTATILLTGENGTGKSMLSRYVHQCSPRSVQPFVSVNMGSITESLFESEMFGHVKGAFTDARENRIGRFELADTGTLFLDEIGNTPFSQQAKLLRVLEESQFEKVGSSRTQTTDCRFVAATNTDLQAAISAGSFRRDLLYRINTIALHVPALRERSEDMLPLAEHFLAVHMRKYAKQGLYLGRNAQQALLAYAWPGNVRELSHVMERAVILGRQQEIGVETLGLSAHDNANAHGTDGSGIASMLMNESLDDIEKYIITTRLQTGTGNWEEIAASLGLSKSAFYRRLLKYGLKNVE